MRMNLKNTKNKIKKFKFKNIKLNSRSLFIFLISFSVFSMVVGSSFYFIVDKEEQKELIYSITNYFTLENSYSYITILKNSLLENGYNVFLIWILGLSVIGVIAVLFIYFCHFFSIGFTISSIISTYKAKGIIGSIFYLIPSKIIYCFLLFILTFHSVKMSYKIIKLCFNKTEINIKKEVNSYFKILLFSIIIIIFVSFLETFIDPFLIRLFTKI